ncbi:PrsW family glutamic-type intramembrane protease [Dehalobacter sp. DCM]|uniref:PrsW family intramembrane metalloprotease n=1 Tax=Dehalobacter sp. DCM TaxID=2907827 RepID=UPI0030815712|nr:PrsW family glutamic-type intramembrane protease [Dehalobacter sp. DCM]
MIVITDIRLIVIALTPVIALGLAVYFTDRYDKEPLKLIFKVFILGSLAVIPIVYIERFLTSLNIFTGAAAAFFSAFIVAGFTEEFFKREVVLLTAYRNRAFDEKLDGIVYAVFASLGFAMVENIMYVVINFSANPYVGLSRGIFSVPTHVLLGVTMGYYLSLAKFSKDSKSEKANLRKALIVPLVLHGFFDFILMSQIPILLTAFIPYVIYLWITNLRKLNHYYRDSKEKASRHHSLKQI